MRICWVVNAQPRGTVMMFNATQVTCLVLMAVLTTIVVMRWIMTDIPSVRRARRQKALEFLPFAIYIGLSIALQPTAVEFGRAGLGVAITTSLAFGLAG